MGLNFYVIAMIYVCNVFNVIMVLDGVMELCLQKTHTVRNNGEQVPLYIYIYIYIYHWAMFIQSD